MNKELRISTILKDLGVAASLSVYRYLRYAIGLVINDMSLTNHITKELYPAVAKKFNTTPPRAERGIRHAIETGWLRGNADLESKMFGYSVRADKGKPTNSEFIATVADYILMTQEDNHGN